MKHRLMVRIVVFTLIFSFFSTCSRYTAIYPTRAASSKRNDSAGITFPLGVFEDAGILSGDTDNFRTMVTGLMSHGLNSVMFTNNFAKRDAALLQVSDELQFNVYMLPSGDLNQTWWPSEIPSDMSSAMKAAQPIVGDWKSHPSFKGYITKDEPGLHEKDKVSLINQAFQQLDTSHPSMPILIGVDRVDPIFQVSKPNAMLIDVYPFGAQNPKCNLTMTGFGYPTFDFVSYIRAVTKNKPATTPLWIILQTHSFQDQLREPSPTEVREEQWLAIGEGAKGIFWFIYSSQQGWKGLVDNPSLYTEVATLTRRITPLTGTLQNLQKVNDQFAVDGGGYVSTLSSSDQRMYVVAVNKDCEQPKNLTISSSTLKGQLKDLETSEIVQLGSPIPFQAGDGKIFELVPKETAVNNLKYIYLPNLEH